jgi:hypothetical protein
MEDLKPTLLNLFWWTLPEIYRKKFSLQKKIFGMPNLWHFVLAVVFGTREGV